MWLSKDIVGFFRISHEYVRELQINLAKAQAENDALRAELTASRTNFDWLRIKVNALEVERAALLEKAYNIKLPVPEIVRQHTEVRPDDFTFDDMGDQLAKRLGLPTFEHVPEQAE